jgi:hypothetical protein
MRTTSLLKCTGFGYDGSELEEPFLRSAEEDYAGVVGSDEDGVQSYFDACFGAVLDEVMALDSGLDKAV